MLATGSNGDICVAGITAPAELATPGAAIATPPTSSIYRYDAITGRLRPVHPPRGGNVHRLVSEPANPIGIYAAGDGGLMRSHDGGANWEVLLGGLDEQRFIRDVAAGGGGTVYAAVEMRNIPLHRVAAGERPGAAGRIPRGARGEQRRDP